MQGDGESVHDNEASTAWRVMAASCWVTPNDQASPSLPQLAATLQAHYLTWMLPFEQVRPRACCCVCAVCAVGCCTACRCPGSRVFARLHRLRCGWWPGAPGAHAWVLRRRPVW